MIVDAWPSIYCQLIAYAKAQRLSHCFVNFRPSVYALKSAAPNRKFEWLPFGFNDAVFRDRGVERDIFAMSVGRRHEPFHEALRAYCSERGLVYEYLEGRGSATLDELSRLAARSRYYVTLPPDLADPLRTGGLSPLTLRYLEGAAAGCRILGARPAADELDVMLPRDALLECAPDGSDLEDVLDRAASDPDFAKKTEVATKHVHTHHPWSRRAEWIHARLLGGPEQDLNSISRAARPS